MSIDEHWAAASSASEAFVQGEVVEFTVGVASTVADASMPLTEEAWELADSGEDGILVVTLDDPRAVVLTQTCDLQRVDADRSHVLIASVEERDEATATKALKGSLPRLAALPWLGTTFVANLARVTTVERSLLINAQHVARPSSGELSRFVASVARYFTRVALPDEINECLRPLQEKIKRVAGREASAEGRRIAELEEIRVQVDDGEPTDVELTFVLGESDLNTAFGDDDLTEIDALRQKSATEIAALLDAPFDGDGKRRAVIWSALIESWLLQIAARAESHPTVGAFDYQLVSMNSLTYRAAQSSEPLDLSYLSQADPGSSDRPSA